MKNTFQKVALAALIFSVPAMIFAGERAYRALENVPESRTMLDAMFKYHHTKGQSRELLALFIALHNGDESIAVDLIETFPDVVNEVYTDLDAKQERTIFLRELGFSKNPSQKIIDACLIAGADVKKKYACGTALSCAIQSGKPEFVRTILDAGASVDEPFDGNGKTPLMFAVERGNAAVVNALIAAGANLDAKTADGKTVHDFAQTPEAKMALILVKKSHTLDDLKLLLNASGDEAAGTLDKILHEEKVVPDEECVRIVLKKSPTPEKLKMLLDCGATANGQIYEELARVKNRGEYYRVFLAAGIRPSEKVINEIFHGKNVGTDMILQLLKIGVMPTERDLQQLLRSREHVKILEACLEGGLDPNMKLAKKPLIMALLDDSACVKLLVEYDVNLDFMVDARHSFRDYLARRRPEVLDLINSVKPAPEKAEADDAGTSAGTKNRNRRERAERPSRERGDRRGDTRRSRDAEEKDDAKADDAENAETESAGTEESAENEKSESAEKSVPEKSAETENSSSSKAYNVR